VIAHSLNATGIERSTSEFVAPGFDGPCGGEGRGGSLFRNQYPVSREISCGT
jgi:hypothetical protein